jgi:hypothetical protein
MGSDPHSLAEKIDTLEALVTSIEQKDAEVRAKLLELSSRIADLCKRAGIYAQTNDFDLEDGYEPEDRVYGHLWATVRGISLCTRSYWEEMTARDDDDEPTYTVNKPETWPIEWLRVAATPEHLTALVAELTKAAESLNAGRAATAEHVRHATDSRVVGIEEALVAAAKEFDFTRVNEEWGRAQRALLLDPPAAITGACALLETTLKHILSRLRVPLPNKQDLQGLYKEATVALAMGNDDGEAEVRSFLRGVASVVQNVGSLRTKVGDAHGKSPDQRFGTMEEARLAVNMAGSASTYLLRRLARREEQKRTAAGTGSAMSRGS